MPNEVRTEPTLPCLQSVGSWWLEADRRLLFNHLLSIFPIDEKYLASIPASTFTSEGRVCHIEEKSITQDYNIFCEARGMKKCSCAGIRELSFSFGKLNPRLCYLCPYSGTFKNSLMEKERTFLCCTLNASKSTVSMAKANSLGDFLSSSGKTAGDVFFSYFPIFISGTLLDAFPYSILAEQFLDGLTDISSLETVLAKMQAAIQKRLRYNRTLAHIASEPPNYLQDISDSVLKELHILNELSPNVKNLYGALVKRLFRELSGSRPKYTHKRPRDFILSEDLLSAPTLFAAVNKNPLPAFSSIINSDSKSETVPANESIVNKERHKSESPSVAITEESDPVPAKTSLEIPALSEDPLEFLEDELFKNLPAFGQPLGNNPDGIYLNHDVREFEPPVPKSAKKPADRKDIKITPDSNHIQPDTVPKPSAPSSQDFLASSLPVPEHESETAFTSETDACSESVSGREAEYESEELLASEKESLNDPLLPPFVSSCQGAACTETSALGHFPEYYTVSDTRDICIFGENDYDADRTLLRLFISDSDYFCMEPVLINGIRGILLSNSSHDFLFYSLINFGPSPIRMIKTMSAPVYTSNIFSLSLSLHKGKGTGLILHDIGIAASLASGNPVTNPEQLCSDSFPARMKTYPLIYNSNIDKLSWERRAELKRLESFSALLSSDGLRVPFKDMERLCVLRSSIEFVFQYHNNAPMRSGEFLHIRAVTPPGFGATQIISAYMDICIELSSFIPFWAGKVRILALGEGGLLLYASGNKLENQKAQLYLSSCARRVFAFLMSDGEQVRFEENTRKHYSLTKPEPPKEETAAPAKKAKRKVSR